MKHPSRSPEAWTTETVGTEMEDIGRIVENILVGKKPRLQLKEKHGVEIIFAS
jgi:hypothetical protein